MSYGDSMFSGTDKGETPSERAGKAARSVLRTVGAVLLGFACLAILGLIWTMLLFHAQALPGH